MNHASFYKACTGPPAQFRLPKCTKKVIDYQRVFHSSICGEESNQLIGALNHSRMEMATRLNSSEISIEDKLKSVDEYLPYILTLFHSLKNQPPVRLDVGMIFEWRGSFSGGEFYYKFAEIIFEVTMVLHAKASLHHSLGWHMLNLDLNSNLSAAGQQLLIAAGIMEYLASTLLPQWLIHSPTNRPPECNILVCKAMAELFTGEAQQMAVVKAMQKQGGTPNVIMAKLCVAVLRIVDSGIDSLISIPEVKLEYPLDIPFCNRTFYASLSYFYAAENCRLGEQSEVGIALGYYRECSARLTDLTTGPPEKIMAFKDNCLRFPFLQEGIDHINSMVKESSTIAERDNNLVFFQAVPPYGDLPPLPLGALIMVRKLYEPSNSQHVVMFEFNSDRLLVPFGKLAIKPADVVQPTNIWSESINNSNGGGDGTGGGGDGGGVLSKSEQEKADHDYAVEMQRKVNAGEPF